LNVRKIMAFVFRDYDQRALDAQYTVTRPELQSRRDARAARCDAACDEVRRTRPRLLDFVYGIHPRERLDIYPTEDDFAPMVVFIHGGYWRSRSKDQFAYLAPTFTDRGANFAALGYPLAPDVRLSDIVASCRKAIHWLLSYPSGLRFDPTRVHVVGHSAGAHLAAMMLATDWTKHALPAGTIRSATCVSGLYDLEPLRRVRHLRDLRIDAAEAAALSPVRLKPPKGTRLVAAVGGEETAEFHRHTRELARAWKRAGLRVVTPAISGRFHFDALDGLTDPKAALHKAAMQAIRGGR
jgi:arylformamidase